MKRTPVSNIILGTMTLGYSGYGARVHDLPTARQMLQTYATAGFNQLDTAYPYGDGTCEQMLGDLEAPRSFSIATRLDPRSTGEGHKAGPLNAALRLSLQRLKADKVALFYLNARDVSTPLEESLAAVQGLFEAGLFDEFGLSNYSVAEVEEFVELAERHNWIKPKVYQGPYNAVSRAVEAELLPVLRRMDIRFHAYNPLAGGAFAPGFGAEQAVGRGSRFDPSHQQGRAYRSRYWNDAYFEAMQAVQTVCARVDIDAISAALRWLVHHSSLDGGRGDGVILGASSIDHLAANLASVQSGPLPPELVESLDAAAEVARPNWPGFSTTVQL